MKKLLKKLPICMLTAMLMMITLAIPAYAKTRTVTLKTTSATCYGRTANYKDPYMKGTWCDNLYVISDVSYSLSAKITSLKSSNPSVASIGVRISTAGDAAPEEKMVCIRAHKPGTTTVSYKVNNTIYKRKIKVYKYTSPFSKIKLGGKDITSKFRKTNTYILPYSKYKDKTLKVSYKAVPKRNIVVTYQKRDDLSANIVSNNKTFKVKKGCILSFTVSNSRTNVKETCSVIFK